MAKPKQEFGLTPYIVVRDAKAAIAFYQEAFGAKEIFRLVAPNDGRIGHAELKIGDGQLFLADEFPDFGAVAPDTVGGTSIKFHLLVEDADKTFTRALKAGATELRKLKNEFYGERSGLLADPFGYSWFISSRVEDVSPREMQERWNKIGSAPSTSQS
jgi:PhnB protein